MQTKSHSGRNVTRIAVLHRAIPSWRRPILQRLSEDPRFEVRVYYGSDVAGAKHESDTSSGPPVFNELWTIPLSFKARAERLTMPLTPSVTAQLFRFSPDVVLMEGASNAAMNSFGMLYCTLRRRPHVWWSLGELPGRNRSVVQRLFRWFATMPERNVAGVVAYSERSADYFRNLGIDPDRISVATNVVDTEIEDDAIARLVDEAQAIRAEFNSPDQLIALFVGALTSVKRVDLLVDAARLLEDRQVPVHVIVVGDGQVRVELEESVTSSNISFVGRKLSDVAAWFQAADLFVLPALGGLSMSQAMVHGLPVIAGSADGTERDLIASGVNGILVGDANGLVLAEAIEKLVLDDGLRKAMSLESRKRVDEVFNIHRQHQLIADCLLKAARVDH